MAIGDYTLKPFTLPNGLSSFLPTQARNNDNLLREKFNAHQNDDVAHQQSGPFSSRPSSPSIGASYFATDTLTLYYYTASGWVSLGSGGGSSLSGSGTANTVALWSGTTSLGNSIMTQSSGLISIAGGLYSDFVDFNQSPSQSDAVGRLIWNGTDGTLNLGLKGGNVVLQVGQEEVQRCRNETGITIPNGTVVHLDGASGNRGLVSPAQADAEATSANTLGVATEDITHNQEGFVCISGYVRDVNTLGLTEGAVLWLSATTPGAFTTTRPSAPNHGVQVGFVVRAHATQGIIYVAIQNGYELDELHDVNTTSVAAYNFFQRNAANTYWENVVSPNVATGGAYKIGGTTVLSATALGAGVGVAPGNLAGASGARKFLTTAGGALQWDFLPVFNTTQDGAVPTPGSALGTNYFLNAAGAWSIPVPPAVPASNVTGGTPSVPGPGTFPGLLYTFTNDVTIVGTLSASLAWTSITGKPSYFPADVSNASGTLVVARGGTGLTTYPTTGDNERIVAYDRTAGTYTTITSGASRKFLTTAGGALAWDFLPVFNTTQDGAVPTPGSALGSTYYLNAAGSWSVPAVTSIPASGVTGGTIAVPGPGTFSGSFYKFLNDLTVVGTLTGTLTGSITGNAATVTNGVYTTGSYSNPSWITALAGSKISGNITGNAANVTGIVAVANGGTNQSTWPTTGDTERLVVYDRVANQFDVAPNGSTGQFLTVTSGAPAWATPPNFSTSTTTAGYVPGSGGVGATYFLNATGGWSIPVATSIAASGVTGGTISVPGPGTFSGAFYRFQNDLTVLGTLTATLTGDITGNAATVTNGVYVTGSYSNPSWITALAGSKISGNISGNAANVTGIVAVANGGTNQATWPTTGDTERLVVYDRVANQFDTAPSGSSGQFLTVTSGAPAWATPPNFSTSTTTAGYVPGSNGVGATYFLNANGTWSVPSTGSVSADSVTAGTFTGALYTFSNALRVAASGGLRVDALANSVLVGADSSGFLTQKLANPSAVTFLRVNADNTVSALDATAFRTAIGVTGDVVGPASATDNAVVRFDATTGKLVQNSGVTIDDSNNIVTSGTIASGNASVGQLASGTASLTIGTGSGTGATLLQVRSAAAQYAQMVFQTGTTNRWVWYKDTDAESGSNAGSTLRLGAHDDAGTFIDNVISITRAAGGTMTLARTINHIAATFQAAQNAGNAVSLFGAAASTSSTLTVRAAAGTLRDIILGTGTVSRWTLRADATAESGSDVGSDFNLIARTDAGVFIDSPIYIQRRAGGYLYLQRPLYVNYPYGAIGGTPNDAVEWYLRGTLTSTGASQYGLFSNVTNNANATGSVNGIYVAGTGAAGTYTTGAVTGVYVAPYNLGAGQSVTTMHGVYLGTNSVAASGNKFGVYISSISGGGTNYALYTNTGAVRFGDAVTMTSTLAVQNNVSVTNGTQANVFWEKTGASALQTYLYNYGTESGMYDGTNTRRVWSYAPATNYFAFYGRVGIGTTSPTEALDVRGNVLALTNGSPNLITSQSDTQGVFRLVVGSLTADFTAEPTYAYLRTIGSYPLYLGTNNTIRMTIAAAGEVTVGSTVTASDFILS